MSSSAWAVYEMIVASPVATKHRNILAGWKPSYPDTGHVDVKQQDLWDPALNQIDRIGPLGVPSIKSFLRE